MNKMTEPADFIGFNNNLFQRMRDMHRSWLERLREIRQIESEFGTRLLIAKSPSETTAICNEWMTKRVEIVVNEQQTFAAAWLGLISDATKATPAISAGAPGHDQIACRSAAAAETPCSRKQRGGCNGIDRARPLGQHVVSGAYDPGEHDRSFDAISNQLSDKRFVVTAIDARSPGRAPGR